MRSDIRKVKAWQVRPGQWLAYADRRFDSYVDHCEPTRDGQIMFRTAFSRDSYPGGTEWRDKDDVVWVRA